MSGEVRVWGLHCKESVDIVGEGVAAMGWEQLGDLAPIAPNHGAFKDALSAIYPDAKAGTIAAWAGQLYRFIHDAQVGEIIVYRETGGGPVNIGTITGLYQHADVELYSQRRSVNWQKVGLLASEFPPGALYELGAYLTWFRIRNHADVWTAVLNGKTAPVVPLPKPDDGPPDAGWQLDSSAIDQATRDFVTRRLATHLNGHGFARLTGHLLELMGYTTTVSPPGKDYGVDIVAHHGVLGLEPPLIKVQAKSTEGKVGSPQVAELLGRLQHGEAGLFVTLGYYSPDARKLADERSNLRLIDGVEFVDLLLDRYDQLNDEYRSRFPLQRVWARDLSAEGDDGAD